MLVRAIMTSIFRADTRVTELIPYLPASPLPFGIPDTWPYMTCTIMSGNKGAIHPPLTSKQGSELAAWIKEVILDKAVKSIFITHCYGGHYFALLGMLKHSL